MLTYERVNGGIKCLRCGLVSLNPSDVAGLYCPLCRTFHTDVSELLPSPPFRPGEIILLAGKRYMVITNEGYYGRVRDEDGSAWYPFHWFKNGEWCKREFVDE